MIPYGMRVSRSREAMLSLTDLLYFANDVRVLVVSALSQRMFMNMHGFVALVRQSSSD